MKRTDILIVICTVAMLLNLGIANAFPPFKKAFDEKYVKEGPESLKKAFKEVKGCNACHQGKKKKPRNPYGKELEKHLKDDVKGRLKKDKKAVLAELEKAFEKAEKAESPSGGGTFGDRIKNGELPFVPSE